MTDSIEELLEELAVLEDAAMSSDMEELMNALFEARELAGEGVSAGDELEERIEALIEDLEDSLEELGQLGDYDIGACNGE